MRSALLWFLLACSAQASPRFDVTFSQSARPSPVDGRIILIVSKDLEGEPRFQVDLGTTTQQIFGLDVDGLRPAEPAQIDSSAAGYPLRSLRDLVPGTYNVQAVLNIYDLPSRRWPRGETAHGSWRRPGMEPFARQPHE